MILVAGLPASGNRLIVRQIEYGLTLARQREIVRVWHGMKSRLRLDDSPVRIVIPVRSERKRIQSIDSRPHGPGGVVGGRRVDTLYGSAADEMRATVFRTVAEEALPVYLFSYEAMVRYPDSEGRTLFEWLRIPWPGWRETVMDANEKYEDT